MNRPSGPTFLPHRHSERRRPRGHFLDTAAQISVISEQLALQLGLDSNGNGLLDEGDDNYATTELCAAGGTVPALVFTIDEVHACQEGPAKWGTGRRGRTGSPNLQWLVLDIETDEATTLDGGLVQTF